MTTAAAISLTCGIIFSGLFYMGIRHRDSWSILVVLLAWAVNYLLGSNHLFAGNVTRVVSTGLVTSLLIDRLQRDPRHVERVAAVQVLDARREMHECQNERASWEARAVAYRRLLEQHGINT